MINIMTHSILRMTFFIEFFYILQMFKPNVFLSFNKSKLVSRSSTEQYCRQDPKTNFHAESGIILFESDMHCQKENTYRENNQQFIRFSYTFHYKYTIGRNRGGGEDSMQPGYSSLNTKMSIVVSAQKKIISKTKASKVKEEERGGGICQASGYSCQVIITLFHIYIYSSRTN